MLVWGMIICINDFVSDVTDARGSITMHISQSLRQDDSLIVILHCLVTSFYNFIID